MSSPQFGERAEPGPGDYCYRHPKRPSFTLCQRCGRTICHECQTSSAVGVLCPECVRTAAPSFTTQAKRKSRAIAWRLSDADAPVVTYAIMVVSAVVFALQWLSASFGSNEVTQALWYAPLHSLPEVFEPWRMFTAMFTHSPGFIFHILFNMYALWLFGPSLERMLGRLSFFILYAFAGIGGSLGVMLWVYFAPSAIDALRTPTVGASGAIFGLLAATVVAMRVSRVNTTSLLVLIGINFAIGFIPGASIAWQAHLGGMVIGALTMWALISTSGPRKKGARIAALSAIGALMLLLSLMFFWVSPFAF